MPAIQKTQATRPQALISPLLSLIRQRAPKPETGVAYNGGGKTSLYKLNHSTTRG